MAPSVDMKQYFNIRLKTCICYSAVVLLLVTPILYHTLSVTYTVSRSASNPDAGYDSKDLTADFNRPSTSADTAHERQYTRKIAKRTLYPLTIDSPYVINSRNVCTNVSNLKFLIIVHTSTDHFQRRRIMRETWANKNIFKTVNLRIVFFFGLTKDKTTQELIENESIVYGDVVQGDFLDTYHNLTHKGVLAYRWTQDFCQQAEMIVKVDDDVFLNVFILLETYYPKFQSNNRSILCHFVRKNKSAIHRNRTKWIVDKHLFSGFAFYPVNHCLGYIVLISRDLIRPMYRASFLTPFFWVDDVYLYGLLPNKVGGVKYGDIRYSLDKKTNKGLECYFKTKKCSYLAVIAWKDNKHLFEQLWYAALSQLSPKMKKEVNPLLLPETP
ncbi:beta-1,3-galactosyltransferase 1-like [Gigantopelta aegis]|uniref:beta-1,3-galactosyltransferase 1-like n=1 Tax=Gigantopelta aegis TaxID=1735272 RepID=UPI001B8876A5|nr:beta-1,3-galactosyltransferase 1-like [Gigantopelta aegis]